MPYHKYNNNRNCNRIVKPLLIEYFVEIFKKKTVIILIKFSQNLLKLRN